MATSTNDAVTEVISRVLFITPLVHVYAIPPLQSNRGHVAAAWTSSPQNEIFTARLRVLETSDQSGPSIKKSQSQSQSQQPPSLTVSILLEDPKSGDLFAGAQYNHPTTVEAAIDSSRFFAIRVTGEGGRKAVLGLGFEERSDALDFSIALQEARKILGLEALTPATPKTPSTPVTPSLRGAAPLTPRTPGLGGARGSVPGSAARGIPGRMRPEPVNVSSVASSGSMGNEGSTTPVKRDWSLKEGQMLTVDLGGKTGGNGTRGPGPRDGIEPPSGGGLKSATGSAFALLPPPPSAKEIRGEQGRNHGNEAAEEEKKTLEELGFDDGEFGEFQ